MQVKCRIFDVAGEGNGERKRPKYGMHALRHAAASLFIEQGLSPKQVQTVLGHATIAMTYDVHGRPFKDAEDDHTQMADIENKVVG